MRVCVCVCVCVCVNWNCISQNNFIHHYFLTTPLDNVEKTILPVPTLLANGNIFFISLPLPPGFFDG